MELHDNIANRFIHIAEGKHQKEGGVQPVIGSVDAGKHHKIHKGDFHNGAKGGVPGGAVGIVLYPVSHADNGGDTVDDQHSRADPVGFIVQAHGVKQRIVYGV